MKDVRVPEQLQRAMAAEAEAAREARAKVENNGDGQGGQGENHTLILYDDNLKNTSATIL